MQIHKQTMTNQALTLPSSPLIQSNELTNTSSIQGIGVHSGTEVNLTLKPGISGKGIVFVRTDKENAQIPARWNTVVDTRNCTTIANQDGVTISTIEHIMAALAARGVDDAIVEVDGPELPILDGSAAPFLELVDKAAPATKTTPRRLVLIKETITVDGDDGRKAQLSPSGNASFTVDFSFCGRANFPDQRTEFSLLDDSFDNHIASARTFGLLEDAEKIKALGLAKGASLDNTVVFDKDRVVNQDGTRFDDECARHKILDAIGDLHLAGGLILGHYHGVHTGHTLNNKLLQKLFATPSAFEIQEPPLP